MEALLVRLKSKLHRPKNPEDCSYGWERLVCDYCNKPIYCVRVYKNGTKKVESGSEDQHEFQEGKDWHSRCYKLWQKRNK